MRYLKAAKLPHIKLKKLAHLTYSHAENGMRKWLKFGNHWIVFFKTYPPIHYYFHLLSSNLFHFPCFHSLSPDPVLSKTELHCGFRCQKLCNGKNETFWVKWSLNEDPFYSFCEQVSKIIEMTKKWIYDVRFQIDLKHIYISKCSNVTF